MYTKENQRSSKMPKPKRELKTVAVTGKVTETVSKKMIKKCEKEDISTSEYLNRLIKADLKIS